MCTIPGQPRRQKLVFSLIFLNCYYPFLDHVSCGGTLVAHLGRPSWRVGSKCTTCHIISLHLWVWHLSVKSSSKKESCVTYISTAETPAMWCFCFSLSEPACRSCGPPRLILIGQLQENPHRKVGVKLSIADIRHHAREIQNNVPPLPSRKKKSVFFQFFGVG